MNLQHLRYFLTLANLEHYTDAAKQLHITQPTLSHAIMMLEEELQVRLFIKQGRNSTLTDAGREFYATVRSSLAVLDTGIEQLRKKATPRSRINLTLLRVLGRKAVPNLVRRFLDSYPDAQVDFDFHNDSGMSVDLITGLVEEKYDIAFCSKLENYPKIQFTPIFAQDFVVIVPKAHPLTTQTTVSIADTLQYPQVWFSKRSGIRPVVEEIFKRENEQPQIVFEVSEDETVAGLVAQGFGLAIIPRLDFLNTIDDITIIEVESLKKARLYYAAYKTDKALDANTKLFIDFIEQISLELKDING